MVILKNKHTWPHAVGKGSADGKSVGQIVYPVAEYNHPGHAGDGARGGVNVGVGVAVSVVNCFMMTKHKLN